MAAKPKKPYAEFPLFAHPNGQWSKKIKGKPWYFGRWADPETALQRYLDEVDDIHAGRDPRRQGAAITSDTVTVAEMCNHFLTTMDRKREAGDVTNRHFCDYKKSCKIIVTHFGRRACASTVKAADFLAFKESFPDTWGPVSIANQIRRTCGVFRWSAEAEVIPSLPNFGPEFRKPPKLVTRRAQQERQAEHGTLDFSAKEVRALLNGCGGYLRASVLLGINAGFGNADCGRLKTSHVDFADGWYDLPRKKTGIPRRFYMWQETRDAIFAAIRQRPIANDDVHDELCFLTLQGRPVWWETENASQCDNISKSFLKLGRKLNIYKPGRNFYSLRRTFETVGGNSRDQVAVNYVMGHGDNSMAAVYRQGIDDQRLIDVAEYVRQWLWRRKCDACGETQFSVADEWKCDGCEKANPADEEAG